MEPRRAEASDSAAPALLLDRILQMIRPVGRHKDVGYRTRAGAVRERPTGRLTLRSNVGRPQDEYLPGKCNSPALSRGGWNGKARRSLVGSRCRGGAMTSPTLLRNYRAVRDLVGDIHQTAIAVDEHLGRFQIYGSAEELALAIAQAEALAAQAEQLKSELRLCARPAEHMQSSVRTGQPVPNRSELSAVS